MCRSIKTLRPPYQEEVTDADVLAAALQYVRKISGFRAPAAHNAEAFDAAVAEVARATQHLLDHLVVNGRPAPPRERKAAPARAARPRPVRARSAGDLGHP
jgi:hypothetical protein